MECANPGPKPIGHVYLHYPLYKPGFSANPRVCLRYSPEGRRGTLVANIYMFCLDTLLLVERFHRKWSIISLFLFVVYSDIALIALLYSSIDDLPTLLCFSRD